MNYISLNIAFSDAMQAEILTAELADYPFESFEADAGTLKAYIPQEQPPYRVRTRYIFPYLYHLIPKHWGQPFHIRGFPTIRFLYKHCSLFRDIVYMIRPFLPMVP